MNLSISGTSVLHPTFCVEVRALPATKTTAHRRVAEDALAAVASMYEADSWLNAFVPRPAKPRPRESLLKQPTVSPSAAWVRGAILIIAAAGEPG